MQVLFFFLYCTNLAAPIMAPQFSIQERNFLMMEYLKHKGSRDYKQGIIERFLEKLPNSRAPSEKTLVRVLRKQLEFGTVHNLNSKASAGDTFSGRRKTSTSDNVKVQVTTIMRRDSTKVMNDRDVSPVSTCRRNSIQLEKMAWNRIAHVSKYKKKK